MGLGLGLGLWIRLWIGLGLVSGLEVVLDLRLDLVRDRELVLVLRLLSGQSVSQSVSHYHTPSRELMAHTMTLRTRVRVTGGEIGGFGGVCSCGLLRVRVCSGGAPSGPASPLGAPSQSELRGESQSAAEAREPISGTVCLGRGHFDHAAVPSGGARPAGSKGVKSAASEAASSSTRGSGWEPSGTASSWECRAAQSR